MARHETPGCRPPPPRPNNKTTKNKNSGAIRGRASSSGPRSKPKRSKDGNELRPVHLGPGFTRSWSQCRIQATPLDETPRQCARKSVAYLTYGTSVSPRNFFHL